MQELVTWGPHLSGWWDGWTSDFAVWGEQEGEMRFGFDLWVFTSSVAFCLLVSVWSEAHCPLQCPVCSCGCLLEPPTNVLFDYSCFFQGVVADHAMSLEPELLKMTLIPSWNAPTSSKVARVGEVLCLLPLSAEPASVDKQGSTTVGGLVMQESASWEPHWFSWQWLAGICTGAFVSCQPEWNVNHSLGAWSSDHCTLREGFCLCLHAAITQVFGCWKPYFFI